MRAPTRIASRNREHLQVLSSVCSLCDHIRRSYLTFSCPPTRHKRPVSTEAWPSNVLCTKSRNYPNRSENVRFSPLFLYLIIKKLIIDDDCLDHGADDDLKMLNVIESFFKSRIRQSIRVTSQEAATKTSKASLDSSTGPLLSPPATNNVSEKNLSKVVTKLSEDKRWGFRKIILLKLDLK